MNMDRRGLLSAGLMLGAGVMGADVLAFRAGAEAHDAPPQPVSDRLGVSVTEYGVYSDKERDQTDRLQKAIESVNGHRCVVFPQGRYKTSRLILKDGQTLLGAPGQSALVLTGDGPAVVAETNARIRGDLDKIRFCGLDFVGSSGAFADVKNGMVHVKGGCYLFERCRFYGSEGPGLIVENAESVEIVNCTFRDCGQGGLRILNPAAAGQASIISQNRFENCGAQIEGPAIVTSNVVTSAPRVGLMLGARRARGQIMAAHNFISGSPVGLGAAAEGDGYYMLALNMITNAKDGAIRAFDKGKPIGPDLARASSEAFRHLGLFGNVAQ
jgi:hypothetical protein